ncbi:GNAT family N-acetyltransferase [Paenibacillus sp. P22]|uniref:GNAT family N-acetyltransferase n=1 Tax=Paenibacillus sp. P22 TaxID=483908 RepID=UPI002FC2DA72
MIVAWDNTYEEEAVALWNGEAVRDGYKEMSGERFRSSMTGHPSFDAGTAFVLLEEGRVEGFAVGCAGDDLPLGDVAGYITCVVVRSGPEADAARSRLLDELERRFRELGRKQAEVLFFNPMRLPWYIPDTPGHEHNNAPGVPAGSSLHRLLLERGYAERALQKAMYLPLADFSVPDEIRAKEERAASAGYRVERLDAARHSGLAEMLEALGNPLWKQEIASAAASGVPVLLAAREGRAAGFAGPVIREDSGRGYFAGIGGRAQP